MRTTIFILVALAFAITGPEVQAETVSVEPVKIETPVAPATPDNSAAVVKPDAQPNAVEPVKSGLDQPLCVQK